MTDITGKEKHPVSLFFFGFFFGFVLGCFLEFSFFVVEDRKDKAVRRDNQESKDTKTRQ